MNEIPINLAVEDALSELQRSTYPVCAAKLASSISTSQFPQFKKGDECFDEV